ncbi:hypothetical protein CEP51_016355 [Fusarium floridanum]|uniref:Heterokaryon incompatibility domain-containing protein n=1 Tax=Fusarium floridanum TaxID=1325733 RepID=A0A428NRX8_9HYPO|nr:hypothetical protein CEP51_016355 [Fusarium floridanum]
MRLLNIESGKLEEFPDETLVSYAILSHRWEDDEVLFQDITQTTAPLKKGWQKVENFCRVARKEGFRYVWIDTCCIDKSSSAELSEAINSMFRWYQNADLCYAYLNDCSYEAVRQPESSEFQKSKWFTRGWTLQELIAPAEVVFMSAEWKEFGTKRSLAKEISEITNIDKKLLLFPEWLDRFCAAQKLSWAATRETTRIEDRAYSLMGLFDINMPLLYGEGKKAFFRLQMEILQSSNDQSIFAWRHDPKETWRMFSSILATSLDDFKGCHTIRHTPRDILIDDSSGTPEFTQQVVGPFIKLKALSMPYDRSLTPGSQRPPWLTSIYQEIFTQSIHLMSDFWVVFLVDCSEEDKTIGIALQPSERGFSRCHDASRFLLPQGLDSRSHPDLKERTFYVRSIMNDTLIFDEPTTFHLRHLPAEYGLRLTSRILQQRIDESVTYWLTNDTEQDSLRRTLDPWMGVTGPGGDAYFSFGFRTLCGTDSLPPFHLQFWHCFGDDGMELVVLFRKGALAQNLVASQILSSPDLLLGPQEFELMGDFVVVVKARNSSNNKILLSISVKKEWTGGRLQESDLGDQAMETA